MVKQAGFTIVEMMVVIAVAAILVAVAVPSFNNLIEKRKITGAAEMIYTQMVAARTESLKRSKDIALSFVDGDAWSFGYTDDGTSCVPGTDCEIVDFNNDGTADDAVTTSFDNEQFPGVSIAVTSDDTVFSWIRSTVDTANTVTLTSDNFELQVQLSLLGRARICSSTGDTQVVGYPDC